jgi:hypothetical protein
MQKDPHDENDDHDDHHSVACDTAASLHHTRHVSPSHGTTLCYYLSETQAKHKTMVKGVVFPTLIHEQMDVPLAQYPKSPHPRPPPSHDLVHDDDDSHRTRVDSATERNMATITPSTKRSSNGRAPHLSPHAFQFQTQGHGWFSVVVDRAETKRIWMEELSCAVHVIGRTPPRPRPVACSRWPTSPDAVTHARENRHEREETAQHPTMMTIHMSKQDMKVIVSSFYAHIFTETLAFTTVCPIFMTHEKLVTVHDDAKTYLCISNRCKI